MIGKLIVVSALVLQVEPADQRGKEARAWPAHRSFLAGLDAFAAGDLSRAVAEWKESLANVQVALAVSQGPVTPRGGREILLAGKDTLFRDLPTPWGIQVAIGAGRLELGEYEAAEEEFRQAWESASNFSAEDGKADAEMGLSLASLYGGDTEAARRYALSALAAYDRLEDRPAAMDALTALGAAEFERGDLRKSALAFAKAERLAHGLGRTVAEVRLLNNQGEVFKALGELPRSVELHRHAIERAGAVGLAELKWVGAVNLAEDLLLSGESEGADREGRDTIAPGLPKVSDPDLRWRAFYVLARIEEAQGRVAEALGLYRNAIDEIESIRVRMRRTVHKIRYQDDKYRVFDRAAHLAWQSGLTAESFAFLERAKGRALMDVLLSNRVGAGSVAPLPDPAIVERVAAQATHLEGMVDRLVVGALRPSVPGWVRQSVPRKLV